MCVQIATPKKSFRAYDKIIPKLVFNYGANIVQNTTNPTTPIRHSPIALFVSSIIFGLNI